MDHPHLSEYPIVVGNPVDWADMDVFKHVNNAVFFRFFENARIRYLLHVGFGNEGREDGLKPILHSTGARFRRPLRYPDPAWTGARVTNLDADRFTMDYRIVSEREGEIAADGTAVVVCYDYAKRSKAPLPEPVRRAIDQLESRGRWGGVETV